MNAAKWISRVCALTILACVLVVVHWVMWPRWYIEQLFSFVLLTLTMDLALVVLFASILPWPSDKTRAKAKPMHVAGTRPCCALFWTTGREHSPQCPSLASNEP